MMYYVIGLGQTGLSVVRYLTCHHLSCEVFDDKVLSDKLASFQAEYPDVPLHCHQDFSHYSMENVKEVIISPGVPLTHPLAVLAKKKGIPVIGDIELFARENHSPVVGITGTNGKSTVTALVGEMAKAAGLKVFVAGNIGEPVLNRAEEKFDWVVLELSSFQLESTETLQPKIACILNITPDHMDRYESFEDYAAAKYRIYVNADNAVMCSDDPLTMPPLTSPFYKRDHAALTCFGLSEPTDNHPWGVQNINGETYLMHGEETWLTIKEMKIKGTHNWSNALAALAMGHLMGISKSVLCETLKQFTGLEHRCQWVREINHVNWYNDSKGTNVGSTLAAIKGLGGAMDGKIVLLLGGQSKDADFAELREPIKNHVRSIVLYGQDADKIEPMLQNTVPIHRVHTFEEVVFHAQKDAEPHDAVLLSPACASWDMFENYGHRGRVFVELVNKLVIEPK
jgi:UDP-N-acetylmuramoylalanine--D-glutamate ligase